MDAFCAHLSCTRPFRRGVFRCTVTYGSLKPFRSAARTSEASMTWMASWCGFVMRTSSTSSCSAYMSRSYSSCSSCGMLEWDAVRPRFEDFTSIISVASSLLRSSTSKSRSL